MSKSQPQIPLGHHAGRALADVIARVVVQTRAHTAVAEAEHRRRSIEGMMDDWEVPLGEAAHQLLGPLAHMDNLPPGIKMLVDRTAKPVNQTDFILNLLAAIGGAIGVLFSWGPIYYRQLTNRLNADHPYVALSPADAAAATVRLELPRPAAYNFAKTYGIDEESFGMMCDLNGEPPPLDEMRQLLFEGRISPDQFHTMFAFSRVRTDWEDIYKEAHQKTLSTADVVEGYIKGQLPEAEARDLFTTAGGRETQFDLATRIAGNPIGVEQAANLYNHRLITDEQFTQVILHSRINPEFEAMAKLTRFRYLTAFQIERMLTQGTITAEEATRWLIEDGYSADQVAGLVAGAKTTKAVKAKNVTVSVIVDSYEAGLTTQADAIAALEKLGYDATEAEVELKAYDARRILSITNQGLTYVRKAYVADRITRNEASTELDRLGVNANLRDHYLALWDIEIKAEFKELTAAQLGSLYKKGVLSEEYVISRWESLGYSTEDATLLAYEYGKPMANPGRPVK